MIETNRVVVHLIDGAMLKGRSLDFLPNRTALSVACACRNVRSHTPGRWMLKSIHGCGTFARISVISALLVTGWNSSPSQLCSM